MAAVMMSLCATSAKTWEEWVMILIDEKYLNQMGCDLSIAKFDRTVQENPIAGFWLF